jgi:hypothetical protein
MRRGVVGAAGMVGVVSECCEGGKTRARWPTHPRVAGVAGAGGWEQARTGKHEQAGRNRQAPSKNRQEQQRGCCQAPTDI